MISATRGISHFADALAFRGRSPCVTKRATHPRVFGVATTLAVLNPIRRSAVNLSRTDLAALPFASSR